LGGAAAGGLCVSDTNRTFVAIAIGLATGALALWIALSMTGFGEGWIAPFLFSPILFLLNPFAFVRASGSRARALTIELILIVLAMVLDAALVRMTLREGVDAFWRVSPLNWVWLALWSGWQVAVVGKVAFALMSRRSDRA
jgi:CDP-diglyceride synthetase